MDEGMIRLATAPVTFGYAISRGIAKYKAGDTKPGFKTSEFFLGAVTVLVNGLSGPFSGGVSEMQEAPLHAGALCQLRKA